MVISNEAEAIGQAFDAMVQSRPALKPVMDAFKQVMVNREVLKATVTKPPDSSIPVPDEARLGEGYPWLNEEMVASLAESWGENTASVLAVIETAFPGIAAEVSRLRNALDSGKLEMKACIAALVESSENDLQAMAASLDMPPRVLKFILGQMLKPFIEGKVEHLGPMIQNIPWYHGYCPVCGAFPEVSYLKSTEGQRWLRCSLCGHEWRFDRMTCPYCDNKNERRELLYVDGLENERAALCSHCHRYIIDVDLRNKPEFPPAVAAVGLVHLDVIAQEKGYLPIAECAWNVVQPE